MSNNCLINFVLISNQNKFIEYFKTIQSKKVALHLI